MSPDPLISLVIAEATSPPSPGLPEWLQGSIGAAATLVAGWLAYTMKKRKVRADERADAAMSQAKSLDTLLDGMNARLKRLEDEVKEMRSENRALEQENLSLRLQLKYKDDVLGAFHRWVTAWEEHEKKGRPDPPGTPPYSWQMIQYLREAADAAGNLGREDFDHH